jgi:Cu/Ag efflux pump CusA
MNTYNPISFHFSTNGECYSRLSGSNGELMIKSVIIPLERALNGVPGMKYMTSDAMMVKRVFRLYLT